MRLVPFRSCALLFLLGFPCLEAHFDFVDNTESFRLVLHDKITVDDEVHGLITATFRHLNGMPPKPHYAGLEWLRDGQGVLHACAASPPPESSLSSPDPELLLREALVNSQFKQSCVRRTYDGWTYEVYGDLSVRRVRRGNYSREGRSPNVVENLGFLARQRRLSRHHPTVKRPRYVEQTYLDGAFCVLAGQLRRLSTVLSFECDERLPTGFMHILDVSYNDACQYRIRLQMIEMCNLPGFNAPDDATSMFCRRYIHPERVQQLMDVLRHREGKRQKALARFANYVEEIEGDAEIMATWNSMNYEERDQFVFSLMKSYDALDDFRYLKADAGPLAAYTVKMLARALEHPEEPFSEEELQHFEAESEYSRIYNLLLVDRLMGIIEEADDETELEEGTVEQIRTAYERVQQDEEEGVHMHDYEAEMRRMLLSKEEILRVLAVFRHEDNIKPLTEEDLISAWRSALYGKQQ